MESKSFSFKTKVLDYYNSDNKSTCSTRVRVNEDGSVFVVQYKISNTLEDGWTPLREYFGRIYQCRHVGMKATSFALIAKEYEKLFKSGFIKKELIK